jgi:hypothetical protein
VVKSNGKHPQRRWMVTVQVEQFMEVSATSVENARIKATRELPGSFGTIGRTATITDIELLEEP